MVMDKLGKLLLNKMSLNRVENMISAKCKFFRPNTTGFTSDMKATGEVKRAKVKLDCRFARVSPVLKYNRRSSSAKCC